jgi:iron complex outermembrane receptor protein
MENQQFGDEHGLGLNDAGVESVEVIKGPASVIWFRCTGWSFVF